MAYNIFVSNNSLILSDSLNAISALQNRFPSNRIIQNIQTVLNSTNIIYNYIGAITRR